MRVEQEVFLNKLESLRRTHPANLCARYMNRKLFLSFDSEQRETLYRCCRSGAENPDSVIGCYLMYPGDLHEFGEFFGPLIREYHLSSPSSSMPGPDSLDLSTLGLPEVSIRVRMARNLTAFHLPGSMDRSERLVFEKAMVQALQRLIGDKQYGGRICSLTPEFGPDERNENLITAKEYQDLVEAQIMFSDMDADPYLKSGGIARDWPYGRACYISGNREVIVWLGEEDHLRIVCMQKGTSLPAAFERLRSVMAVIEAIPGMEFAYNETFGYVNSCPSNLGTGMRASVQISMPHLTAAGADVQAICERAGLSVCGTGGEHTPIGTDGMLHLTPRRRLFVNEREVLVMLFEGIRALSNSA